MFQMKLCDKVASLCLFLPYNHLLSCQHSLVDNLLAEVCHHVIQMVLGFQCIAFFV